MPADSFICGDCEAVFHVISDFLHHKSAVCSGAAVVSEPAVLLEESLESQPAKLTVVQNSQANQQIFMPAPTSSVAVTSSVVGQHILVPVNSLGENGLVNNAPTDQYETSLQIDPAVMPENMGPAVNGGLEESKVVPHATLCGGAAIEEKTEQAVVDGIAGAEGVSFSQMGEDGQTIYSYVLTREQLVQLGVQSEENLVGQCEQIGDSSQVTIMVSSQELQDGGFTLKAEEMSREQNAMEISAEDDVKQVARISDHEKHQAETDTSTRIRLVPVESTDGVDAHAIIVRSAKEMAEEEAKNRAKSRGEAGSALTRKRGRGRPAKDSSKPDKIKLPEPVENSEKPPLPEKGPDGRYTCSTCKKAFTRERHYKTHRCLSWDDYVDITKSEAIDSFDRESAEEDTDDTRDFVLRDFKAKKTPTAIIAVNAQNGQPQTESSAVDIASNPAGVRDFGSKTEATNKVERAPSQHIASQQNMSGKEIEANKKVSMEKETVDENAANHDMPRRKRQKNKIYGASRRKVENLPIFTTEQDKLDFDTAMNVDLSFVDNLYSSHLIAQDVNSDFVPPNNFRSTKSVDNLTVYTCNECKRVFMSQSHCRLHCLSHTDAKPFKCIKCDYSTNAKGHLYTHIRLHTGQMYQCSKCNFSTGNKTHLVEHEETHSSVKHTCAICKKVYSTKKSLTNHIRVYHTGEDGKSYLLEFMVRGPRDKVSMLHQCYVCNRKFKKRVDRDRHLFCHNIRDVSTSVYSCDVCSFTTYRQSYLDKHYLRHKIVYVCAVCESKFASTVRLNEHLSEKHRNGTGDSSSDLNYETWKDLFEKCIDSSLYLKQAVTQGIVEVEKIQEGDEFHYVTKDPSESTNPDLPQPVPTDMSPADVVPKGNAQSHDVIRQSDTAVNQKATPGLDEAKSDENASENFRVQDNNTRDEQSCQFESEVDDSNTGNDRDYFSGLTLEEEQEATLNLEQALSSREDPGDPPDRAARVIQTGMPEEEPDEEEEMDTSDPKGDIPPAEASRTVYKRLDYQPLTMEVFQYIRQVYGNEECEFCGRLFYLHSDYEPHLKMHTGEKPFACEQCDFRAISKHTLKRHVQREHEQVIFKCSACDYEGSCRTQLWTHQKQMHSGIAAICSLCGAEFPDFKLLRAHLSIKHRGLDPEEKHKMVFPSSKKQIGRRVYKCPHCDKTFLRAYADFQRHLWIHEGIKPFKCPVCTYYCRSKTNLKTHLLKHSNDKPFLCNECGKAYKSKTALRWHVRSHKYGKAFKCTKCNYQATQKSHLTRHMETHDIVKAHVCQHCDFSANTLGYMKIHYTRFHKGCFYDPDSALSSTKRTAPNAKVYKCAYCEYLFGNLAEMKRHLRSRHNMRETEVCDIAEQQMIMGEEIEETEIITTDESQHLQVNQIEVDEGSVLPTDEPAVAAASLRHHMASSEEFPIESASGEIVTVKRVVGEPASLVLSQSKDSVAGRQYPHTVVAIDTSTVKNLNRSVAMDTASQDLTANGELKVDTQERPDVPTGSSEFAISRNSPKFSDQTPVILASNGKQYFMSSSEVLAGNRYQNNELIIQYISQNEMLEQSVSDTELVLTDQSEQVGSSDVLNPVLIENTNQPLQNLPISVQDPNVPVMESSTLGSGSQEVIVTSKSAIPEGAMRSPNNREVMYIISDEQEPSTKTSLTFVSDINQ